MAGWIESKSLRLSDWLTFGVAILLVARIEIAHAEDVRGVTDHSIKIGTVVPLSGSMAIYGDPMRTGTVALIGKVNAQGGVNGRKIDLLVEDNAYSAEQTVSIARKLISRDKIFAFLNPNGTVQMGAVLPYVLKQQKVPVLFTYGGLLNWYDPPQDGLYGLQVLYETQGRALGQWAARDGKKNILVMRFEVATFEKMAAEVESGFKSISPDGTVSHMAIKLGTQDYAPIALEVIRRKPDAIVTFQTQQEMIALARELRNQGFQPSSYSWAPNVAQSTLELGAAYVEGMKGVSWTLVSPVSDEPVAKEFREAVEKYSPGSKPDFTAFFNYGQAKVFVEALSRVKGELSPESFYEALHSLKGYESGILPPVTFSPEKHQGVDALQPMEVKGGIWVPAGAVIKTGNN